MPDSYENEYCPSCQQEIDDEVFMGSMANGLI